VAALPSAEPLLVACSGGDREAFSDLFDRYRDRVYAIAWHLTGDRAAAADVTQDVFMKLLTRLPQFRGQAAFSTWLYRIVVNATHDYGRSRRRAIPFDALAEMPCAPVAEERYAQVQRRARIRAALLRLPVKLRIPVVLRHVEGLAYDEIAVATGVSPGTVASRLSRAHRRLARELSDLREA
jgi:RNA polymerase sigma-70 factor (ECF subfamily)